MWLTDLNVLNYRPPQKRSNHEVAGNLCYSRYPGVNMGTPVGKSTTIIMTMVISLDWIGLYILWYPI